MDTFLATFPFPTAALLIGCLCIIFAILKNIQFIWFQVNLLIYQQILIVIFGFFMLTIALLSFFNPLASSYTPYADCSHYKLRIQNPRPGDLVGSEIRVSGSFENLPLADSIILINKQPEDPGYWPSSTKITVDPKQKVWTGDFYIGGNPPQKAEIIVGIMKYPARILYNYYMKIGTITNSWYPIDNFLEVVSECDRIPVTRSK